MAINFFAWLITLFNPQIPQSALDKFIHEIEQGYIKYKNPYHNNMHAADVTQTVHYMICQLGLMVRNFRHALD